MEEQERNRLSRIGRLVSIHEIFLVNDGPSWVDATEVDLDQLVCKRLIGQFECLRGCGTKSRERMLTSEVKLILIHVRSTLTDQIVQV